MKDEISVIITEAFSYPEYAGGRRYLRGKIEKLKKESYELGRQDTLKEVRKKIDKRWVEYNADCETNIVDCLCSDLMNDLELED